MLCGVSLLMMTALTSTSAWTFLTVPFILGGAGIGLVNPPLASTAIGVVPHERSGMASGINATFRQVGIATGIAGLGAIFQHEILSSTTSALRELAPGGGTTREVIAAGHGQLGQALSSGSLGGLQGSIAAGARTTLDHAYRHRFRGRLHDHRRRRRRDRADRARWPPSCSSAARTSSPHRRPARLPRASL